MRAVGLVSIAFGLFIVISRGWLFLAPAVSLRWFGERISTETRTRIFGIYMLPLPALMIWAGASEDSGLAGVLLILGLFILVGIPWLAFFPRSYMDFCGLFLPPRESSNLVGWRTLGLLAVFLGLVFVYFGWRAL